MDIYLKDSDLSQMPEQLRSSLFNWLLNTKGLQSNPAPVHQMGEPKLSLTQLDLNLDSQTPDEKPEHSHVRLTQLLDAGITKPGIPVRVRLKREVAKKLGRNYINGLEISPKGTIVCNGQEFDKPSPLAAKVNDSSVNGWEYIEVKNNDQWVCLDELREIWRKTND